MELKPGYKQTDAGVIPADWDVKELGSVASFSGGAQPPKHTFLSAPKAGYLRLVQIRDYKTNDFATYIPAEMAKKRCAESDIMIGRYGPPIFQILRGIEGAYNVALMKAVPSQAIDHEYLFYILKQEKLFAFIEALSQRSSGQTGVELPALKAYAIPLPSLPEQRAIAATLSDMDVLLIAQDKLITKKRDVKQAAMQELLTGKRRLPGFDGVWKAKRMGDLGRCLRGVSYQGDLDLSPHDTAYTIRLLRSNNVQNATVLTTNIQFVNAERVSDQQMMQASDILICMANGSKDLVGKAALFNVKDGFAYTFGAFMGCYRTNPKAAFAEFVFFLFQTDRYRQSINNLLAGSSINNLRPSVIEGLIFQVPIMDEQAAIAAVLSDIDAELVALQQRRDKTLALKQGMMQELLTGRTRLV